VAPHHEDQIGQARIAGLGELCFHRPHGAAQGALQAGILVETELLLNGDEVAEAGAVRGKTFPQDRHLTGYAGEFREARHEAVELRQLLLEGLRQLAMTLYVFLFPAKQKVLLGTAHFEQFGIGDVRKMLELFGGAQRSFIFGKRILGGEVDRTDSQHTGRSGNSDQSYLERKADPRQKRSHFSPQCSTCIVFHCCRPMTTERQTKLDTIVIRLNIRTSYLTLSKLASETRIFLAARLEGTSNLSSSGPWPAPHPGEQPGRIRETPLQNTIVSCNMASLENTIRGLHP